MKTPSYLHIRKNFLIFIFLLFLGLVNFGGSLRNPFIIDDTEHYLNPKKMNNAFLVYDALPNQVFYAQEGMKEYQNNWGYYRPFTHLFYRLQAQLLKDNPVHYHLMCIIFFVWACYSIFQLLLFLTKNELAAFIGAMLYLLHPFQGLCVNYKTALVFPIQIIFLNTAFLIVVNNKRFLGLKSVLKYLGALLCFICALLIHELAFIFPAVLFFYWLVLDDKKDKGLFTKWLGFVLISMMYLFFRFHYESTGMAHSFNYKLTLKEFFAAYAREIGWVIKRFIYPKDIFLQSATWVSKGVANQWIWVFYAYLVCFFTLWVIFYRNNKVLFFLWGVFSSGFILSIPGSRNMLGSGLIYFEPHWIFYTTIGLFGVLGVFFSGVVRRHGVLGWGVVVIYIFYLMYFSFVQNNLYSKPKEYFQRWADDSPNLDLPKSSVCWQKAFEHDIDGAIECFVPLTQQSRAGLAYSALGTMYEIKKDIEKAKENYLKAKEQGVFVGPLKSLSMIAYNEGNMEEAIKYLDEALVYDRFSLDIFLQKAEIYVKKALWHEALDVLKRARQLYPLNGQVVHAEINIFFKMNEKQKGRTLAKEVISRTNRINELVYLSVLLMGNAQEDLAKEAYVKAYQIDPSQAETFMTRTFICPLKKKEQ